MKYLGLSAALALAACNSGSREPPAASESATPQSAVPAAATTAAPAQPGAASLLDPLVTPRQKGRYAPRDDCAKVAGADAFDTITSDRTYKKARTPEDALSELQRCGGAQFDPELLEIFVKAMRRKLVTVVAPPATEPAEASGIAPRT